MPEQVRCPSCEATLRVPDTLLGKNVKCPKCQTTFLAETEAPEDSERIVRAPAPSSRRSRVPDDTEDEELPPEEEDEDRPRRRRRGRRTAAAESAVAGPAIALMVIAGLDIALTIVDLLLRLLGIGLYAASAAQASGRGRPGGPGPDLLVSGVAGIGGDIFSAAMAVLILVGALKMKSLSSYGLAMTACIVSMIPCHSCCCLGLPFGIWGLVMLNKPEVKDAFSS